MESSVIDFVEEAALGLRKGFATTGQPHSQEYSQNLFRDLLALEQAHQIHLPHFEYLPHSPHFKN